MLEKLRSFFFHRLLRQTLAQQNRKRQAHTLESALSIGILFDATKEPDRLDILKFAGLLKEQQRKKVQLLGFVDARHPLGQTKFPQFTQKELRWNGKPFGPTIDTFTEEKYDLLLCLNQAQVPALNWLAISAQAGMKIGTAINGLSDFDMMLETPAEKGVPFFIDQLGLYLDKIIPAKHESTSTP